MRTRSRLIVIGLFILSLLYVGLSADTADAECRVQPTGQTYTAGLLIYDECDSSANKRVMLGATLAGEAVADDVLKVEMRGYYTSITTAATTVVKSGPGWFQGCKVLGGTLGNVTIYDNTAASGAVIFAAFTPTASGDLQGITPSFSVGLTVVTAAATNLTCVVR